MANIRQGVDNPAATEDDGRNQRTDVVISVQPQTTTEIGRAELPVSTTDWRSAQQTQGQFIPMNGLDFLIGVPNLLIQQTVELDDMISRIESENRYIVKVPQGEALYIASEVSTQTQRCLCGTGRGFVMRLHDNTRQEALVISRRLAGASCCFPCRLQQMTVTTPSGDYIGRIQQQWTLMVPFYLVRDKIDNVLFLIEGPATIRRGSPFHCEFKIITGDSLREVGKISHSWNADLVSFTTNISFPPEAVQPKQKALLLAAGFLLEYVYFERAKTSCWRYMINICKPTPTLKEKSWEYQQYYVGEKDKDGRRSGYGENNWSGAKSLEGYSGKFIHNTMHGIGDYHWRYLGSENIFVTYEGYFYCNRMHGYGVMSYPDGKTFQGLLCNNIRWGPGIESNAKAHQDVGIWRGNQLVRLTWRPDPPSIAPDLMTNPIGRTTVESHRTLLSSKVETVDEVNRALELLKESGADPRVAVDKWIKLYPKNCTDLSSPLCQTDVFERAYYDGKINSLQEVNKEILGDKLNDQIEKDNVSQDVSTFYAWNNGNVLLNIMKHCYMHEKQRSIARIDLKGILSGPRQDFKPAGDHELNSRSLLMASYLGYVADVAELVIKKNIHPDVADIQGNSALMYAASGDQTEAIHFLVEAGANIDLCNDCCCTPLGVVLMRFTCAYNDISPSAMVQALFPPPATTITLPKLITAALEPTIFEWNINRDLSSPAGTLTKSISKIARNISSKKIKSLLSIKDQPVSKRKIDAVKVLDAVYDSDESLSDKKRSFNNINREYCIKISDVFSSPISPTPVPYIFYLIDMVKEIDASEEEQKKAHDKIPKKVSSKTMKNAIKTSKDLMWQNNEAQSIDSAEKLKIDLMSSIKQTILQLLSDGANPKLVQCPQPALYMAIMSKNSDLIRALIQYGADVNETYPRVLNYTPLDIAVSRPYNAVNLEVVHTLLACGADPCHRLIYDTKDPAIPDMIIPGPTLLHAVLARKVENVAEEDVCRRLLELLLQYDCDPLVLFKGSSAIDVAMNNNFDLLDIFVKSPKTCLNGKINNQNQSILVKMFSNTFFKTVGRGNRLQTFTNLLLFGADPLFECQNGEDIYPNIFVFAKKTLNEMEYNQGKPNSPPGSKPESKGKKTEKPKSKQKIAKPSKPMVGKIGVDDIEDYRQAIEQVTDCARSIHIRWLEARLVKELIRVIDRYKHRQWNMILKELGDTRSRGLWLTPQRCLEIWNLLSSTKKKIYNDQRVLRYLLCIVIFISWNNFGTLKASAKSYKKLTAVLKDAIEADVVRIIRQQNKNKELPEIKIWKLSYVKPELTKDVLKFNICFECALPLEPDKIVCCWCKLISFCSYECIKKNISRANCHPCSDFLKQKYFPTSESSVLKNVL